LNTTVPVAGPPLAGVTTAVTEYVPDPNIPEVGSAVIEVVDPVCFTITDVGAVVLEVVKSVSPE
jgi:hypothetical protein